MASIEGARTHQRERLGTREPLTGAVLWTLLNMALLGTPRGQVSAAQLERAYVPPEEYINLALTGQDLCSQLPSTEAMLQAIDTKSIRAACGDASNSRGISWSPCGGCLCALTSELSKVGLNTTYSLELYTCADKLAPVLQASGLSGDDGAYMLSACPAECRATTWVGAGGGTVSRCPASPQCARRPVGYPQAFKPPPGYANAQDYCNRALSFQASWDTDAKFAKSTPLTGNKPKGCVIGCILGMAPQDMYARTFNWDGKCFLPGNQIFNYNEPGRNAVLEGVTSSGISWYDEKPAIFLEYPDNWWWQFWTRTATLGQIWDYTIYHDELREDPTKPGLFHGLTYIRPFNNVNLSPLRVIGIRFALLQTAEGLVEDEAMRDINAAVASAGMG